MRARIVLFDWTAGGHRPVYVRRFVEALRPIFDVVLALPQETLDAVGDLGAEALSLGEPRPAIGGRLRRRRLLAEEAALFREAASIGDDAIHLYADNVLPQLVKERAFPGRTSLLVYYPRAHYRAIGTRLSPMDAVIALAKDRAVRSWRQRPDAQAVFTLDEEAARRWAAVPGARAQWLPEPPVRELPAEDRAGERAGCIVWGALDRRKGIDLLTRALTLRPTPVRLVIAGRPADAYRPELERHVASMEASGVAVELHARTLAELDGLRALAGAACAVLPYRRHPGMSRVLVEACSVETPVVVHRFGLLGHLVRTHGLGLSVDCHDPEALRAAVIEMSDPAMQKAYSKALAAFARRFTPEAFRSAIVHGLNVSTAASPRTDLASAGAFDA
jgi:hypothetical protein